MRHLLLVLMILPSLAACASQRQASVKRSTDAVVQDESQRQKVQAAVQAGDTPDEALAKASDGPKQESPAHNSRGPAPCGAGPRWSCAALERAGVDP
jgi:hypothetical protein